LSSPILANCGSDGPHEGEKYGIAQTGERIRHTQNRQSDLAPPKRMLAAVTPERRAPPMAAWTLGFPSLELAAPARIPSVGWYWRRKRGKTWQI